ncbi:ImmA/IrrE family metallo-endopeptidase [Flavobacterium sp. MDT1-60]|uniref:ImmA/IrrE family metallo-endopeptidase n=1 Tax=Flavobacterium sp. MDT1-60 TaxID=1979344 RepID=UPI00177CA974|nr:ImmA/IrrE family metallo-endopeptidase [Flavobacterium sp. MDT1-60]QOG03478.1 ImmA/IrrE family metallo-endopeptidase [Flavobacterium sp. MDT1-60]
MNNIMSFEPNWVSPPGDTIRDILDEQNITISNFASQMGSSIEIINELIIGDKSINQKIASKLEAYLGVPEEFWLTREKQYRFHFEKIQSENKAWLSNLPFKFMNSNNWIENGDYLQSCLDFFNVPSVRKWKDTYENEIQELSFRTSQTLNSDFASVATWLRRGEIIANQIECKPWNKTLFEISLNEIKKLTRLKNPKDFLPKLVSICAEAGVAVAVVPTPPGCKASGATKFLNENKAILLLSFRYLTDDQFWFTFFHEAGHLILHKKTIHIEMYKDGVVNEQENEANTFAAEFLVPYTYHNELRDLRSNQKKIIKLACELGISAGIIIGQMQYLKIIDFKYLNSYKRRYNWEDINQVFEK